MNELRIVFQKSRDRGRTVIIPFITAGDPHPPWTIKIIGALIEGGADIVELGVPFSDPIADGVTIQASSERALRAGTNVKATLKIAEKCRKEYGIPIVILSYYNPIFRLGLSRFLEAASDAGISGVIIPDLPIEEADEYLELAQIHDISTIFLASPTTRHDRLVRIVKSSSGFVYLVSLRGVTGAREKISEDAFRLIKKLQDIPGRPPIAVGFGVSSPAHVRILAEAGSEGVIIGSALIRLIEQNLTDMSSCLKEVRKFIESLADAGRIDRLTL